MVDKAVLSKLIKEAMKSGKYAIGAKESAKSLKTMRAVIITSSVPKKALNKIKEEAKKHKTAVIDAGISSVELSEILGFPYRVSALAIRSISDSDINLLVKK